MFLNKNDGSINKFITIEHIAAAVTAPTYTTYAGVLFEESESLDGQPYIYVAFNKDFDMHIVKIANTNPLEIKWHYYTAALSALNHISFIMPDPKSNSEIFMAG